MMQIDLQQIPEQKTYVSLTGQIYIINLYEFRGLMYIDVYQVEQDIVRGERVIANTWLLPDYCSNIIGNMRFETYDSDKDDYVRYDGYNTKFRLTIYSRDELSEMNEG